MFSEILNIKPKLDQSDMRKMERTLSTRFGKVAKGFGKGLIGSLVGGGLLGAGIGIIEKLLNPLKEVQESIDRTLKGAGDTVDNAIQFNTTPGKLRNLETLAGAKGLDADGLYMLINKFQTAVAEQRADMSKTTAVKNYVNEKDSVEGFYKFIQNLNMITDKQRKTLLETEVFGEKQVLKAAAFINEDQGSLQAAVKLRDENAVSRDLVALDKVGDTGDILKVRRDQNELERKARLINVGMQYKRDRQLRKEQEREEVKIGGYSELMAVDDQMTKLMGDFEKDGIMLLRETVKLLRNMSAMADKLPSFRGMRGSGSGTKDN